MASHRNLNLDIMRLMGLFFIVMVHANPPGWIFQIRNFGTPLLIVASALTYAAIYGQRELLSGPFFSKRLPRLIFPAWIFISVLFAVFTFLSFLSGREFPFSRNEIIESYFLYEGIGYVWILKVYLFLALITPWSLKFAKSQVDDRRYFAILAFGYAAYELALPVVQSMIPVGFFSFFNSTIFTFLPYGILYLYGMRLVRLSDRRLIVISLLSLVVFVFLAFLKRAEAGSFVSTQYFKYPPTFYYLIYAFIFVNAIYVVARNLVEPSGRVRAVVIWLSSNSLWIYLWHIMAIFLWDFNMGEQPIKISLFLCKFAFVLSFGVAAKYLQVSATKKWFSEDGFWGRKALMLLT